MLSAEEIVEGFNKHKTIIETYISEDRVTKINALIDHFGETYYMAPASGKTWFHSSFAGGYVFHVNLVVELAIKQAKLYSQLGGTIDFTLEELVFAAIFHDLGKLGDGEKENYLVQTDKWRKEKLQEVYVHNPELDFMLIQDRSLFLLQKFGLQLTQKEYLAIRLHDGVYDEANKAYFINYNPDSKFKTSIVYILHTADFLASKIEYDLYKKYLNS